MKTESPWELIIQGEYQKAIERLTDLLSEDPQPPDFRNRGLVYLILNDYQSALSDFSSAISMTPEKFLSDYDYICQGMCYWFMNDPQKAIGIWELSLSAPYTDSAGGIEAIALFLYAGICINNEKTINKGRKLLSRYWKDYQKHNTAMLYWPAHIAPFLLGEMGIEDFLNAYQSAKSEILQNRWKCQIYFYLGIKGLIDGDIQNYQASLRKCLDYDQTKVDYQYYLARWTVNNNFPIR
jgi:hypothetical protein